MKILFLTPASNLILRCKCVVQSEQPEGESAGQPFTSAAAEYVCLTAINF